jgi:pyruvate formate lyase activating enzyme
VTFSGGEPLLQPGFLRALLHACREHDIHTVLDTCGFATWQTVDSLRADVDLFLYDLKVMDDTQHQRVTGVSNDLILKNLEALSQRGHDLILRLPLIPGINDDEKNLRRIGAFAARLPHLIRVDILPYHATARTKYERTNRLYDLREIRPPTAEKLAEIVQILQESGLTVQIGG